VVPHAARDALDGAGAARLGHDALGEVEDLRLLAGAEVEDLARLAERGCAVTAFDFAPNAVRKAQALAAERGVRLTQTSGDILGWDWDAARYDAVVAVFIQFLAPAERPGVFAGMRRAVRPGGLLLLEGYRPAQLAYGTGGPGKVEHLYTRAWLEAEFAGWDLLHLAEYDAEISEGAAHRGRSALIDLVARRPG
jgi:SAM-dependent methyltransferase